MTKRVAATLAAVVAAGAGMAVPAASEAGMRFADSWGSEGFGNGQFGTGREARGGNRQYNSPGGIAIDSRGRVFVADTSSNRIQRFSQTGSFQAKFGAPGFNFDPGATSLGSSRRGFLLPQGIAIAGSSVFIADNRNDRIVKWSTNGRFQKRISRRGSIGGKNTSPWGIAVAGGRVFVVDQGNFKIKRYTTSGFFQGAFGNFGFGRSAFRAPYGIAATRSGVVFVSDTVRDQVLKFTSGGRLLAVIGRPGSGDGQFDQPAGVALDPRGNLLVADCANQRIQRLTQSGRHIETFGHGVLQDPTFLAATPSGRVFVSDFRRVVRFDPTSGASSDEEPEERPGRLACVSQAEGAS